MAGVTIVVRERADVERARHEARDLATALGWQPREAEQFALAASELGMNLVRYARGGELVLSSIERRGVQLESRDRGPGIADVERAVEEGFSTGGGLGAGLSAVQRMMDEFGISSSPRGTHVITRKWA
jgi:serine/threonine-protein kinase RsbT